MPRQTPSVLELPERSSARSTLEEPPGITAEGATFLQTSADIVDDFSHSQGTTFEFEITRVSYLTETHQIRVPVLFGFQF